MERFSFVLLPFVLVIALIAAPNQVLNSHTAAKGKTIQIVTSANASEVGLTQKYFVGGVKEVPGDVTQKFLTQCTSQKTKLCKWYQFLTCSPTLICNDKEFWSKRKGYSVQKK